MKKIIIGLVALLSFSSPAYAQDATPTPSANINRFTLSLAQAMMAAQADAGDNIIASPYNALMALGMAGAGAQGTTQAEFNKVLFGGQPAEFSANAAGLTQFNGQLLQNAAGKVDLLSANSIWVNRTVATLKPAFDSAMQKNFAAKINDEDFSDPAVPAKINGWASENTKGLITKVIEKLNGDDAMVLSSALYFKGVWSEKFDKKAFPMNLF